MLRPIFHTTAFAVCAFSLWYDQTYLDLPSRVKDKMDAMPLKGRLMFLTIWCLIMQTAYHFISLLNDILGSNEPAPRRAPIFRKLKDTFFSVAFPIALYVSTSFWGIYNFDKELVFPEVIAKLFPVWLNHTMHTTVSVFILLELLLTNISYPSRKVGLTLSLMVIFGYISWMHILRERLGVWAYPIFDVLNLPQRIAFLSVAVLFGLIFYVLGEKLSGLLSSAPKRKGAEPKKKRK